MECLFCSVITFLIIYGAMYAGRPTGLKNFAAKHGLKYSPGIPLLDGASASGLYYGVPIRVYIRYTWFQSRRRRRSTLPEIIYELRMGNCIPPGIEFYKKPLIPFGSSVRCNIPAIDNLIFIRKVDSQTSHRLFSRPGVQQAVFTLSNLGYLWSCKNNMLTAPFMYTGASLEKIEETVERLVFIVRSFQDAHTAALAAESNPNPQIPPHNQLAQTHENPH